MDISFPWRRQTLGRRACVLLPAVAGQPSPDPAARSRFLGEYTTIEPYAIRSSVFTSTPIHQSIDQEGSVCRSCRNAAARTNRPAGRASGSKGIEEFSTRARLPASCTQLAVRGAFAGKHICMRVNDDALISEPRFQPGMVRSVFYIYSSFTRDSRVFHVVDVQLLDTKMVRRVARCS
jgi:hypothetical protein